MTQSEQITAYISSLTDWRGQMLADLRGLILEAGPDLQEEWKWGTPVYSFKGNVVAIGAFKDHIKLNFFKGASLPDPRNLFNAGLEAKTSRGIDLRKGDLVDVEGIRDLVRNATALNTAGK